MLNGWVVFTSRTKFDGTITNRYFVYDDQLEAKDKFKDLIKIDLMDHTETIEEAANNQGISVSDLQKTIDDTIQDALRDGLYTAEEYNYLVTMGKSVGDEV